MPRMIDANLNLSHETFEHKQAPWFVFDHNKSEPHMFPPKFVTLKQTVVNLAGTKGEYRPLSRKHSLLVFEQSCFPADDWRALQ